MLGALARKEVDIAGPFVATEQRAQVADFTNCLEFSRLGIITGIQSADRNMFLYFKVFTWQIWTSLAASILACALVSSLLYNFLDVSGRKAHPGLLLSRYFWIFWSFLIGHDAVSLNHWALRPLWFKYSFRLLLVAWMLGPVINSVCIFQGSVTSSFAVSKMKPVISDMDELTKKGRVIPVITKGSAIEICFKTSEDHYHLWRRMANNSITFSSSTVEKTLEKVEKGTHVLLVDYIYGLSIAANWVKKRGHCNVQVEEALFCQNFISLALKKGFDHVRKRNLNLQLTYIVQAKLTDRWLNRILSNYTHCTRLPSEGSKPLSLTDVMGGLAMWGAGIGLAVLVYVVEMLKHHQPKRMNSVRYYPVH